ncbi:MAG: GNAT family N-acetyltransferase [Cellvibrionaceae bacterium]
MALPNYPKLQHRFLTSIDDVNADQWNAVCGNDYPFLRYEFFAALEKSQSTNKTTGWQPYHLIVEDKAHKLLAALPLFIKHHSYGEYVFDWAWADAYHRYGQEYYPKLLNAIPFTPATGPRWGIDKAIDSDDFQNDLFAIVEQEALRLQLSSSHWLFTNTSCCASLTQQDYMQRVGCQYHWLNKGYKNFDHFLESFTSRKRKNLNKERRKVSEQNIQLLAKEGAEITEEEWQAFYLFYHMTYFKRSGRQGYLSDSFFPLLANSLPQHLMMVQAFKGDEMIAAALYFKDSDTLYGRYWGCKEEYDQLHFEACYYQGIEYAIRHQLKRFDPGAQGEHKIQRGFTPIKTYSYHWIANDEFRDGIAHFLQSESKQMEHYIKAASERLPFKTPDQ